MRKLILAATILAAAPFAAHATQISAFSQNSGSNTLTATQNGAMDATHLVISNATITVSQLFANIGGFTADFTLSANSIDAAQTVLGLAVQHFSGNFCITSGSGCTGTDFLSGSFTDAAVGALSGPGIVVNVNNPPDTLTLASDVIPAADLAAPNSLNFGFSNISTPPGLSICGTTLCSFTASVAGTVSANVAENVPEPTTLTILGTGLLGLGLLRRHRA